MTNPQPYTLIIQTRDGQMAENWNQTDDLGMMQQLGVIPVAGG
jgi:hypothetical protein